MSGGTYPAQQEQLLRNRAVAHRMSRRGQSVAEIAAYLQVAQRSVWRYLAAPCPDTPPAPPKPAVELSSFYMQGACYGRFDIECATCPVMRMCRTYGLTAGLDDWGVWGGLTRPERQKVAAARKTGTESVA
jgi:hypothetical protein